MSIYTRAGDTGTTSLYGGGRVAKDDPRMEVCGTIDELSASLGLVRAEGLSEEFECIIMRIQRELISLCTEIVSDTRMISMEHVRQIEGNIDHIEPTLPPLANFIISGDHRLSSLLHFSRTVCRRAERHFVTLCRTENLSPILIAYLNRLSDLLFITARAHERRA